MKLVKNLLSIAGNLLIALVILGMAFTPVYVIAHFVIKFW